MWLRAWFGRARLVTECDPCGRPLDVPQWRYWWTDRDVVCSERCAEEMYARRAMR